MAGDFKRTLQEKKAIEPITTKVDTITSKKTAELTDFFVKSKLAESTAPTAAQLLHLIANNEQNAAEALLQKNRKLLLEPSDVMDPSGHHFKNIKGFQYAVWALDWHMWKMLLKYLPQEEAAEQLKALEENGTDYGKEFDLNPLIEALKTYIQKCEGDADLDECSEEWCKKVGGEQAHLVAHVVNEYCQLDYPFFPLPSFTEPTLSRTRRVYVDWHSKDEWFSVIFNKGNLGETFAYSRGESKAVLISSLSHGEIDLVKADLAAIQKLFAVRKEQRQSLRSELLKSAKSDNEENTIKQQLDTQPLGPKQ